jgi:putative endopeptidase
MKKLVYFSLALLAAGACQRTSMPTTKRVVITGIDVFKKPGDDFFTYANGIWNDTAQIPPSQTGVGSYSFLNYPQRIRLQGILDSVSTSKNPAGSIEQKVGDFYASGMDTSAINKRGYEPIKPLLARIDAVTDIASLLKLVADEQKAGNGSIIGFYVGPDDKQSTINIAQFGQTGIGLPERAYYFKTDSATISIQNAYKNYLTRLFDLTGTDAGTAQKNAVVTYDIEKQLADAHRTNIELRDVKANYNKLAVTDLSKKQPALNWTALLTNLGVNADSVNVGQPAYYDKLDAIIATVPLQNWKVYLKAQALTNYADLLSQPFVDCLRKSADRPGRQENTGRRNDAGRRSVAWGCAGSAVRKKILSGSSPETDSYPGR